MDDQQAIALLERMVAIPSLSTDEGALAAFLVEAMAAAGFDAHIDAAGNALGAIGAGEETVVLLGHMDTVPGAIPVRIEDGALWGRGAVDAKGPLAAFVAAAARAAAGGRLRRRVLVAGCVEEEVASSKGAHHLAATWPAPAWCVVGEPSGADRVTLGYKGSMRLAIRLEQPAAHSAHASASAAERGCALWQALRADADAFNAGRERAFDQLLPTLVRIESQGDGLRDWCELLVNVRLPLDCGPDAYQARVAPLLAGCGWSVSGATPAFAADRSSPLARRFGQAMRGLGVQPRLAVKTGTADLNVVGPAWGCPAVAYGPGDAALDHTPEERIELAEYLRGIAVLEAVLTGS